MANKQEFRVGHPAYKEWSGNHAAWTKGIAATIRELRSRGIKRDDARAMVKSAQAGNFTVVENGIRCTELARASA